MRIFIFLLIITMGGGGLLAQDVTVELTELEIAKRHCLLIPASNVKDSFRCILDSLEDLRNSSDIRAMGFSLSLDSVGSIKTIKCFEHRVFRQETVDYVANYLKRLSRVKNAYIQEDGKQQVFLSVIFYFIVKPNSEVSLRTF